MEGNKKYRNGEKDNREWKREAWGYRYYINSLKVDEEAFRRAVRGHWSVESMHWHLDVTFREDANWTLDKQAAQNQNIIRKWSLSRLKMIELLKPGLSMKKNDLWLVCDQFSTWKKSYPFKKCNILFLMDGDIHAFVMFGGGRSLANNNFLCYNNVVEKTVGQQALLALWQDIRLKYEIVYCVKF